MSNPTQIEADRLAGFGNEPQPQQKTTSTTTTTAKGGPEQPTSQFQQPSATYYSGFQGKQIPFDQPLPAGCSAIDVVRKWEEGTYNECPDDASARSNITSCLDEQCSVKGLYTGGHLVKGPNDYFTGTYKQLKSAFPDMRVYCHDAMQPVAQQGSALGGGIAPSPNLCFTRLVHKGTFHGLFMGFPGNGKQVEFSIWCLAELDHSTRKITRCDMVWDMLSLLENIGFPVEGIPVLGLRDRVSGAFGQVTAAAANLLQTGIAAPGQLLHQAAGLVGLGGASTSDAAMQQEPENK